MGKIYTQGEVLTALDLNASLAEAVNVTGYFVFTGEHVHNTKLTANATLIVNTNPSYFYSRSNFYLGMNVVSGNIHVTSGTINDTKGNVRNVNRDSSKPNGYYITTADAGKFIYATGDVYIPANIFQIGENVTIFNSAGATVSVKQVAGSVMYLAGIGSTGDRTLDTKGLATVLCVDNNTYVITGAGLN
jgi:hypothetical protein